MMGRGIRQKECVVPIPLPIIPLPFPFGATKRAHLQILAQTAEMAQLMAD